MEPLGARKPSELLNHMLELCPRGEEKNKFFLFLFLQRLPIGAESTAHRAQGFSYQS
jgi:hypothetical protein